MIAIATLIISPARVPISIPRFCTSSVVRFCIQFPRIFFVSPFKVVFCLSKRILSIFLVLSILLTFAAVPASAASGSGFTNPYDWNWKSTLTAHTLKYVVDSIDFGNLVVKEMSSKSFLSQNWTMRSYVAAAIRNWSSWGDNFAASESNKSSSTAAWNMYSPDGYVRSQSHLNKYFRPCSYSNLSFSSTASSDVCYTVDASDVAAFSEWLSSFCGGHLQGYYVSGVQGYIYRVVPDSDLSADDTDNLQGVKACAWEWSKTKWKASEWYETQGVNTTVLIDAVLGALACLFVAVELPSLGSAVASLSEYFPSSGSTVKDSYSESDSSYPNLDGTCFLTAADGGIIVGKVASSAGSTKKDNNSSSSSSTTQTVVENNGDTYNVETLDEGDTITYQTFDYSSNVFTDVQGDQYNIDNLVYDYSDRSYTVNNTYNIYFYYDYTYYIQIGSSEEYVGAYQVYYELPDGRSSKDLTADEIYGLESDAGFCNFDVANENPDLLGLWAMDGDLTNSAVGNARLYFVQGASSTYLETDNFNGALYMPYSSTASAVSVLSSSGLSYSSDVFSSGGRYAQLVSSSPFSGTLQFRGYIAGNFSNVSTVSSGGTILKDSYSIAQFGSPTVYGGNFISTDSAVTAGSAGLFPALYTRSTTTAQFGTRVSSYTTSSSDFVSVSAFALSGVWNDYCLEWDLDVDSAVFAYGSDGNDNSISSIAVPYIVRAWVNGASVYYSAGSLVCTGKQSTSSSSPAVIEVFPVGAYFAYGTANYAGSWSSGSGVTYSWTVSAPSSGDTGYMQIDNVRLLEGNLFPLTDTEVPVAGQPFDSNKVLVLPDDTSNLATPTIAVYSDLAVGETRIGGVRPSIPSAGDVYCYVENNRITSIQQYDGSGWLEVGGMIWTGSRWVQPSAYDVVRYADLYDVSEEASEAVVESIIETNNILESVLDVLEALRDGVFERLDKILAALGITDDEDSGSGDDGFETDPDNEDNSILSPLELIDAILSAVLSVLTTALTQFINLVAGLIGDFISAIIDFIGGLVGAIVSIVSHIGTLADSVSGVGDFVSDCWECVPEGFRVPLQAGFAVLIGVALIAMLL